MYSILQQLLFDYALLTKSNLFVTVISIINLNKMVYFYKNIVRIYNGWKKDLYKDIEFDIGMFIVVLYCTARALSLIVL